MREITKAEIELLNEYLEVKAGLESLGKDLVVITADTFDKLISAIDLVALKLTVEYMKIDTDYLEGRKTIE